MTDISTSMANLFRARRKREWSSWSRPSLACVPSCGIAVKASRIWPLPVWRCGGTIAAHCCRVPQCGACLVYGVTDPRPHHAPPATPFYHLHKTVATLTFATARDHQIDSTVGSGRRLGCMIRLHGQARGQEYAGLGCCRGQVYECTKHQPAPAVCHVNNACQITMLDHAFALMPEDLYTVLQIPQPCAQLA